MLSAREGVKKTAPKWRERFPGRLLLPLASKVGVGGCESNAAKTSHRNAWLDLQINHVAVLRRDQVVFIQVVERRFELGFHGGHRFLEVRLPLQQTER